MERFAKCVICLPNVAGVPILIKQGAHIKPHAGTLSEAKDIVFKAILQGYIVVTSNDQTGAYIRIWDAADVEAMQAERKARDEHR